MHFVEKLLANCLISAVILFCIASSILGNGHFEQGLFFLRKGELEKAIDEFEMAIKENPDSPGIWYYLGLSYFRKGMFDQSLVALENALEIDPQYVLAMNCIGDIFHRKGMYKEAIHTYKKAIDLQPNFFLATRSLADVYRKMGNFEEAEIKYQKAIPLNKKDTHSYLWLGLIYVCRDNVPKAKEIFDQAIKVNPYSPEIKIIRELNDYIVNSNYIGLSTEDSFESQKDIESLILEYKKKVEAQPNDPYTHFRLGLIYILKEMYGEAKKEFNIVISLDPEGYDAKFLFRMNSLLSKLG